MIRVITKDQLPLKKKIKALDMQLQHLRERLVKAPEEARADVRAELQHVLATRHRLTLREG